MTPVLCPSCGRAIATYDETKLNATARAVVAAMLPKVGLECTECRPCPTDWTPTCSTARKTDHEIKGMSDD